MSVLPANLNAPETMVAVVHNKLIDSRHNLSALELKILAWVVMHNERQDTEFKSHRLRVIDFAKLTGVDGSSGSTYRNMEQAVTRMQKAVVQIESDEVGGKKGKKRTKFNWFIRCIYYDDLGEIELQLHPDLKPYYLELKNRFTQVPLLTYFKQKSRYTIRIFELLMKNKGALGFGKSWQMPLTELREFLDLKEKFKNYQAIKVNILEKSRDDLDEANEYSFDYDALKVGGKVEYIRFRPRNPIKRTVAKVKKVKIPGYSKLSSEEKSKIVSYCRSRLVGDLKDDVADETLVGFVYSKRVNLYKEAVEFAVKSQEGLRFNDQDDAKFGFQKAGYLGGLLQWDNFPPDVKEYLSKDPDVQSRLNPVITVITSDGLNLGEIKNDSDAPPQGT